MKDQAALAVELTELIRENVLEAAEELTPETNLFDAGLDSMAIMQLLLVIEENFGVMLDGADLTRDNFGTATDLAGLIRERAAAQESAGDG